MTKIFYGVAGEGLGHASRTLAVIDSMPEIEFHVFTFGKAYEFFQKIQYPHLHNINGLMFQYKNCKVDYPRLAYQAVVYFCTHINKNIRYISDQSRKLNPQLFISDFEPSVARASKRCGKNLISVDNQHRFAYTDLVDLPLFLRMYGWCCGLVAKFLVPNPNHTVISTFHYDHIAPKGKNVTLSNGLFRKNIVDQKTTNGDFLLIYCRRSVSDIFLKAVEHIKDIKVKVYGSVDSPVKERLKQTENFEFCELSPDFAKDLAGCKKLLTTAGNQLVSEARYFGKHCLVIPEPGQYEQSINAFYAEKIGMGVKCDADKLTKDVVENFMKLSSPQQDLPVPNGADTVTQVVRFFT